MADPRFFDRSDPIPLGRLAEIAGCELQGGDPALMIHDVAPLDQAAEGMVSFIDNPRYLPALRETRAAALCIAPKHRAQAPEGAALLLSADPYRAFAKLATAFYPVARPPAGIHPSAVVDPTARVDGTACIEACAVIGPGAEIGPQAWIEPHAVIGRGVVIGEGTRVGPHASVSHALVGRFCHLYPGSRIGQDGFGFAMGAEHLRVPQLGRVLIEDHVEIGANTTIDRGAGPDTVVARGAMIDNLVQLGHNVRIGRGAVLVSQSGVAGSTEVGDYAVLAAQSGLAGHLKMGKGARLAAKSGTHEDLAENTNYVGLPAMPAKQFWRMHALLLRLLEQNSPRARKPGQES